MQHRLDIVDPPIHVRDALDFVVYFRVDLNRVPIFFLEVKTARTIGSTSGRADADEQMRLKMAQLFDASPSVLYGISALGTRLCFYMLDKTTESLTPQVIPRDPTYVNDVAPASRWNADILTDVGYNRFMSFVHEAKGSTDESVSPFA